MVQWFDTDDSALSASQALLIAAIRQRVSDLDWPLRSECSMVQIESDLLTLAIDISDPYAHHVLRTLRIDVHPDRLLMGTDATYQLVTPLQESDAGVEIAALFPNLESAAAAAVDWLMRQALRPIDLHTWERPECVYRRWVLADSEAPLLWSDSMNTPRRDLGRPNRVIRVWPPEASPNQAG